MRLSIEDEAIEWHRVFVQAEQIRVFEGFCKEKARKPKSGQIRIGVQYTGEKENVPCHTCVASARVLRSQHGNKTSITGVGPSPLLHSLEHFPSTQTPYSVPCCPPEDVHCFNGLSPFSASTNPDTIQKCLPPAAGDIFHHHECDNPALANRPYPSPSPSP